MEPGMVQMMCGNCGTTTFGVFSRDEEIAIHIECINCHSASIIQVKKPSLEIEWGENSEGVLCFKNH